MADTSSAGFKPSSPSASYKAANAVSFGGAVEAPSPSHSFTRSGSPSFRKGLTRQLTQFSFTGSSRRRREKVCSEEFKQLHAVIQQQVRTRKGVINPRNSKWVPYWDTTAMLLLIFTAVVTPIEVCLFSDTRPSVGTGMLVLFVVNRVTDVFFTCDLILSFFMCYQETSRQGGLWVTNKIKIRQHYLRGWFTIDLLSVIPFDLMMQTGVIPSGQTGMLRLVRTVRLLRLVKLLRILRASRLLARWQSFFGISYAAFSMLKFFTATFFMVHLMACAWSWLGLNWVPSPGVTLAWEQTWLLKYQFSDVSTMRLYVISLYVAVVAMFGGVGPLSPANYAEYVLYTSMMLFGSMVWAWVIGSLCGILATLNPHATAFQNTMDELEYFMRERNFPQMHRVRLRDFFRQTKDYSRLSSYQSLMIKMSVQLRGDTAIKIGMMTLSKVGYFSPEYVEKEFLAVVALNLQGSIYDMRESLPVVNLTSVTKGMAAKRLQIFSRGAVLGTDCVIPDDRLALRDLEPAACLTFVQTSQISRAALMGIVAHFPLALAHIKKASIIYTLRAAFKQYYKAYKDEQAQSFKASFTRGLTFKNRVAIERRRASHVDFNAILESIEVAKKDGGAAGSRALSGNKSGGDESGGSFNKGLNGPPGLLRVRRGSNYGARPPGFHAGFGLMSSEDEGGDGMGGGGDVMIGGKWLGDEISSLRASQIAEAGRMTELISRNESVELQVGVLNDKLELILSLLMKSGGAGGGNGTPGKVTLQSPKSVAAAMGSNGNGAAGAAVGETRTMTMAPFSASSSFAKEAKRSMTVAPGMGGGGGGGKASLVGTIVDGHEIRRRRKPKHTLGGAASVMVASRRMSGHDLLASITAAQQQGAQRSRPPIGGGGGGGRQQQQSAPPLAGLPGNPSSLVGLLSSMGTSSANGANASGGRGPAPTQAQAERVAQMARERAELRDALNA